MNIMRGIMALCVAGGLAAAAQADHAGKVVYHVSEIEKVGFALGNIRNHINGVGGADHVEIVLVAHGPALKAFHDTIDANPKIMDRVSALQGAGVRFEACGNTMNAQSVSLDDLMGSFARRDEGGVVRIADLQSQGYLYIRP